MTAAEQIARMMHLDDPPGPPSAEEIAIVQALERDMKCGAYARRAFGIEREDDAPALLDRALGSAPESLSADMARAALSVQEGLRSLIHRARARAGELSAEEAESACTGTVAPDEAPLPVIEREAGFTAPEPALRIAEPLRADTPSEVEAALIQMFGDEASGRHRPVQMFGDEAPVDDLPVQMFGDDAPHDDLPLPPGGGRGVGLEDAVQMFGDERVRRDLPLPPGGGRGVGLASGKVTLRIRASEETILHYRMLQAALERAGIGGTFVRFLVTSFWSTWAEVLGRTNACEAILRRDGYACTCPVCTRPSAPGSHHVRYRSHGGGDEPSNLTSPCERCHLDGEHGGRLRITGQAPDLTWCIGRTPIMEVRGRERRVLG